MSATSTCKHCGRRFFRFTPDGKRALGSLTLIRIDPNGHFCTLRCAAKYGVIAASKA